MPFRVDVRRGISPRGFRRIAAGAILVATPLVATGCSNADSAAAKATTAEAVSPTPGLQNAFVDAVNSVLPSVVEIQTSVGLGSGVIFDSSGDIVTNDHVVGTSTSFQVLINGSSAQLTGQLVGTYPASDLAVIKVTSPKPLSPAAFGDSADLHVGDVVLAMGNPLGLEGSTTEGIVSALGRTVTEPDGDGSPGATLKGVVQTSAAINPGNSGGALVNLEGQVVGIPTLTATDPQIGGTAPGIGFAIPSSTVTSVAQQLIATGQVTNPPA
jgi:putative serine protease PepD